MKSYLILFFMLATITVIAANNYCDMSCKDGITRQTIKHIGCRHNNLFDQHNCPKNAQMVPITEPLKKLLVDAHNEKRNFIAGGGDRNHRPACRMATMEWDDELAELAALNVKQCRINHDKCHNTNAFQHSGQSLYTSWQSPPGNIDAAIMLNTSVEGWFNEVEYSRQSIIDSFPDTYSGPAIGHFTVMMADRNTHVGCAASTYTIGDRSHFLAACNYATNNIKKQPIYAKCSSGGESCKKKNKEYPNLCSENEKYDVNKWF